MKKQTQPSPLATYRENIANSVIIPTCSAEEQKTLIDEYGITFEFIEGISYSRVASVIKYYEDKILSLDEEAKHYVQEALEIEARLKNIHELTKTLASAILGFPAVRDCIEYYECLECGNTARKADVSGPIISAIEHQPSCIYNLAKELLNG